MSCSRHEVLRAVLGGLLLCLVGAMEGCTAWCLTRVAKDVEEYGTISVSARSSVSVPGR